MKQKKIGSKILFLLRTIPMASMRYRTIGDWEDQKPVQDELWQTIKVGDMGNPDYNFLVLIHELVEAYMCSRKGMKDAEVTGFDKKHLKVDDPGSLPNAPYHLEHTTALMIEAAMAMALDVDWTKYEKAQLKEIHNYKKKK